MTENPDLAYAVASSAFVLATMLSSYAAWKTILVDDKPNWTHARIWAGLATLFFAAAWIVVMFWIASQR